MTCHVELRIDTAKAVHALVFNDDGLICNSELYSEIPQAFAPAVSPTAGPLPAGFQPPSG